MNEASTTSTVMPIKGAASRKRSARHSRPVVVEFLPAIRFELPIFYGWERPFQPIAEMVLAGAGESLAVI